MPVFTHRLATLEASRCLLCYDAPCSKACPAQTDPAKFIRSLRFCNDKGGAQTIRQANILGACCALVCPYEQLCQGACARTGIDRPIEIGKLQTYLLDQETTFGMKILSATSSLNVKVACIGAGPASLACATALRLKGYDVTIFEAQAKAGGMLSFAIPEHRLPQSVVDQEIKRIEELGVKFVLNAKFGKDFLAKDLKKQDVKAIFLGLGLGASKMPAVQGNTQEGVLTALDFLKHAKLGNSGITCDDQVIVVGGGDSAMDCASTAVLCGAKKVTVVYRKTLAQAPANKAEIDFAQKQGVGFNFGFSPKQIVGNKGKVIAFKASTDNGSSSLTLHANKVIFATGQEFDYPKAGLDLKHTKENLIETTEYMTSKSGVFAGGDAVNGGSTVVQAVADGKASAEKIDLYLKELAINDL